MGRNKTETTWDITILFGWGEFEYRITVIIMGGSIGVGSLLLLHFKGW